MGFKAALYWQYQAQSYLFVSGCSGLKYPELLHFSGGQPEKTNRLISLTAITGAALVPEIFRPEDVALKILTFRQ